MAPVPFSSRGNQYQRVTKIFDISVPVRNGGTVYPGNPETRIAPHSELSQGASSNLSSISFGSHTGTHVDAPRHFLEAGTTVDRLPLTAMIGAAQVLAFPHDVMSVSLAHVQQYPLDGVERVLLRTRNSTFINDGTFHSDFTYLEPDAAEYLASIGVKLVGVDYFSVE